MFDPLNPMYSGTLMRQRLRQRRVLASLSDPVIDCALRRLSAFSKEELGFFAPVGNELLPEHSRIAAEREVRRLADSSLKAVGVAELIERERLAVAGDALKRLIGERGARTQFATSLYNLATEFEEGRIARKEEQGFEDLLNAIRACALADALAGDGYVDARVSTVVGRGTNVPNTVSV